MQAPNRPRPHATTPAPATTRDAFALRCTATAAGKDRREARQSKMQHGRTKGLTRHVAGNPWSADCRKAQKKCLETLFFRSLHLRHDGDDLRVTRVGDREHAHAEELSARGTEIVVVAAVVVDTNLGQHRVVLNLKEKTRHEGGERKGGRQATKRERMV